MFSLPIPDPPKKRPLYVLERDELPPYRFVPESGMPHPTMDPAGHWAGRERVKVDADVSEKAWMVHRPWLEGVDYFNHFYFWEAYEAWEPLWAALPKEESPCLFVQALMMCACAYLKVHTKEDEAARAFWGRAEVRFGRASKTHADLWGLPTKKTHRAFEKWFTKAFKEADKGKPLPVLDKSIPLIKLPA